jgi:hypothetical protein
MAGLWRGVIGAGLTFFLVAGSGAAEMEHTHPMGKPSPPAPPDTRTRLDLQPAVQEAVKLTMREHLEALQSIVSALGREDFEAAAKVAHEELGFPKHHQALQREQGAAFPSKYQELAMAHHQAAEDLAKVIATKDLKRILPQLEGTIRACVMCHQEYKF